jgi:beta-galactosidase
VDAAKEFDILLGLQPDKALLAMEYWTGWFDHWMEPRHSQGNTPQGE